MSIFGDFERYVFDILGNEANILLLLLLVFCGSSRSMTPITETHHRHLSSARFFADRHILLGGKSSAGTLVSGDIRFVLIFGRVV